MVAFDPEFQAMIPPLQAEERAYLEANIIRDGCRDPLVAWRGLLLDGHNRYDICEAHGIDFEVMEIDLPDRNAAADWIDTNQLGRRNLTPDQASLLRGRRYNRTKRAQGGDRRSDGSRDQNDPLKTAERLAKQHGVSAPTIKRDGQFARAVEALKPAIPDIEQRVLTGDVPSKSAVVEAAREPVRAVEILNKPHVTHNSGEIEWYTPAPYIAAARAVMDGIDLDPASSEVANEIVKADRIFTVDDDGLAQPWAGRIWMNPPYASRLVQQFTAKLLAHVVAHDIEAAIVLVNNATETQWFRALADEADAICFKTGRIQFIAPGKAAATGLQGQAFLYFGAAPQDFIREFQRFGFVMIRADYAPRQFNDEAEA